jgi:hypothetical protein
VPDSGSEPVELEAERITRPDAPAPRGRGRRPPWLPFAVAIGADAIQWLLLPLFFAGVVSPWDEVLDVAIAIVLIRMVGWHWAFLPTFVVELLPVVDLVPSWTMAVWLATRAGALPPDRR